MKAVLTIAVLTVPSVVLAAGSVLLFMQGKVAGGGWTLAAAFVALPFWHVDIKVGQGEDGGKTRKEES